ncbi:MAG TPA: GAF domain-containing protein [Gaiellaceae bacterium]|nr:GAF domain-containing protein [Gaiellaceae bacterium]
MPKRDPTDQLRRLQAVTDVALVHLELEELLTQLLLRVRDALEADTCAVLMLDGATDELVARAAIGIEEEVEQGVRIPVGGGFAGRVAATKEAVILPDVDHADVLNPILREKGIKSLLGVPLLISGDVLGVLHVGALQHREFDADDIELLQLVADRVALAIEHARAFEAERSARRRLEQIQSITDAAISQLALDALFSELLVRIHDILAVDTVAILLLDEHTMELVARAAVGIEEEVEQGVRIPFGGGFAGRVAATAAPVFLPRVDMTNVLNPILLDKGIKSLLGVPLIVSGRVTGVLHVGSLTPRLFDRDDTELLQLVAERVALAIERATLHEEMLELDALKLNFVAVASHELRTPATSVYGILATLRERGDSLAPELRHELEETLWSQTLRLRRLIEQLLDLSRLDAARIQLELRPVELTKVLVDVARNVDRVAADGSETVLDVGEKLTALADPAAIERIVSNLLLNAHRYGKPPVTLSATRTDSRVRICVRDHGEGVPPELRERLFQRFERGGNAGEGSGLGLSIARAYARAHGGDVVYDPRPEGPSFEFFFPAGAPD